MENKKVNNDLVNKKDFENKINNEKNKIVLLEQLESDFDDISKGLSRCIDLVSNSISGVGVSSVYADMHNDNRTYVKYFSELIEKDICVAKKNINRYYEQNKQNEKNRKEEK